MLRKSGPLILCIAAASCGGTKDKAMAQFDLASAAFRAGQPIPVQHTCDGANQSPPLAWGDPPSGTKSFALVLDDIDAPGGTFRHWGVFDIPASAHSIGGGGQVGTEATNDFGKVGYGGPCPPKGGGPHHYRFKLYALDVAKLDVDSSPKISGIERAVQGHVVGRAELTGTYARS
jgi:Raf kinase inhibitor-like YbhB/YbcL family protein